jgi:hypothetical protein
MSDGYAILLWDGYGAGLVRINPRLLTNGVDIYGNPKNWFSCEYGLSDSEILNQHGLTDTSFVLVIR